MVDQKQKNKIKLTLPVQGMTCASCVLRVENALKKVEGVEQATVNLATESATVEFEPAMVSVEILKRAVADAGYKIVDAVDEFDSLKAQSQLWEKDYHSLKSRFVLAVFLTVLIMIGSLPEIFKFVSLVPVFIRNIILMLLTAPVMFYAGRNFFVGFWRVTRHGTADMNTLIAVGTAAAFFYSMFVVVFDPKLPVYFDTSAVIVTLILLGKILEAKAKWKSSEAVKKLIALQPTTAHLIFADSSEATDGKEVDVPLSIVQVGNLLRVKPGERIPVDGKIVKGFSLVDESMLTGESVPIQRNIGESVLGGTVCIDGTLIIQAEKLGKDSFIARVANLVEETQASKPPVQRLVDRVASVFVPAVIVAALISGLAWAFFGPAPHLVHALMAFVAVLIIACPCALGLATPTAIMVGTGKGAEMGILIKNSEALEQARKITSVVFDKTGTITAGEMKVVDTIPFDGVSRDVVLSLAAFAEAHSEHPIAKAIVEEAKRLNIYRIPTDDVSKFKSFAGNGVEVSIEELLDGRPSVKNIRAGKLEFVTDGKNLDAFFSGSEEKGAFVTRVTQRMHELAATVLYISSNLEIVGAILVSDYLRGDAKNAVMQLHQMGLKTYLLTGDGEISAKLNAEQTGIQKYFADVSPEGKLNVIKDLQERGEVVAFVGDGINDAPALVQADLGIAMASGTDIALETADVTLIRNELSLVPVSISLSRSTLKVIKQNLFWAFMYNIILIPVAGGALYPFTGIQLNPMIASIAMALSSVSVVSNSLRLKRFKV
jgi:Cu+-exporting ATPase